MGLDLEWTHFFHFPLSVLVPCHYFLIATQLFAGRNGLCWCAAVVGPSTSRLAILRSLVLCRRAMVRVEVLFEESLCLLLFNFTTHLSCGVEGVLIASLGCPFPARSFWWMWYWHCSIISISSDGTEFRKTNFRMGPFFVLQYEKLVCKFSLRSRLPFTFSTRCLLPAAWQYMVRFRRYELNTVMEWWFRWGFNHSVAVCYIYILERHVVLLVPPSIAPPPDL